MSERIKLGDRWSWTTGHTRDIEHIHGALLQEIADHLRAIRSVLECPNAVEIPEILRAIRRNTTKPKRRK